MATHYVLHFDSVVELHPIDDLREPFERAQSSPARPHVSDDNPYSEAIFRTLKHTPVYPRLPFADLASANRWVARFVDWYKGTHRHSAIRYVTPDQRHHGHERAVLASRRELYERVRRANPERWTGATRNWLPIELVVLNPERAPQHAAASPARQQA